MHQKHAQLWKAESMVKMNNILRLYGTRLKNHFSRDGQKPDFFQNPGFGFNPGFKMENPGFSG